ncbi:GNAT family N-acetyltransferase [Bradyrhizobium sp. CCBAU 21360]|uniref:GNAT family N-acetyltransferase n=1 Tax=Bradyrhizobium sp. CCBAU 21360 TaxID=1325081 RepID=UPI002305CB8E|nr:GNAT family N-acetyltransferase [Bradyrhizobium sp. CCBAU 21360]
MIRRETEHLVLTSMLPEHEKELFELHNDPLVQKSIYRNVPQTIEHIRKIINMFLAQWQRDGFGFWMVYEKTNHGPIFIGRCGLRDYEDTNNLEFVYVFFERGAGRGLGPEAARFTITHALQNSTKEKVVGVIAHSNERAKQAAKKLGLRYIDDRWHDGRFWQYYEMTREEFFLRAHHQVVR